jgi:hypothetical protein
MPIVSWKLTKSARRQSVLFGPPNSAFEPFLTLTSHKSLVIFFVFELRIELYVPAGSDPA